MLAVMQPHALLYIPQEASHSSALKERTDGEASCSLCSSKHTHICEYRRIDCSVPARAIKSIQVLVSRKRERFQRRGSDPFPPPHKMAILVPGGGGGGGGGGSSAARRGADGAGDWKHRLESDNPGLMASCAGSAAASRKREASRFLDFLDFLDFHATCV
ncbi:uncharacterized protein V6R79_012940 [Siganus canaliculatus]